MRKYTVVMFILLLNVAPGLCGARNNSTPSQKVMKCPDGLAPGDNEIREVCHTQFMTENNRICQCPRKSHRDTYSICRNDGKFKVLIGRWGYIDSKNLLETINCPLGYCQCQELDTRMDGLCIFNKTHQCTKNREGVLCSRCKPGFSVKFGSEDCEKCQNKDLWILVPAAVCLSIIVLLILYFNFDAFSGYLNAFLYSYQMMMLFIPKHMELDGVSLFLIYTLGLQGTGGNLSRCLFDGMNNLHKMAINYLIPGYMLAFTYIVGIFLPPNMWNRLFERTVNNTDDTTPQCENETRRKSFGRAISFVLVICYSSITNITLDLFDRVDYKDKNVVYKAAFVDYSTKEHIPYLVLAVFVALFVVILFPMILCFTAFFERHFPFFRLHRYESVINALKSSFEDQHQWFVVFYFICRIVLLVVAVYIKTDITRLLFLSICCVVFLMIISIFQPYKERTYNIWDIILLSNLCVMSNTSLILQLRFAVIDKIRFRLEKFLQALIYVPLASVILRMMVIAYKMLKERLANTNQGTGKSIMFCLILFYASANSKLESYEEIYRCCLVSKLKMSLVSIGILKTAFKNLNFIFNT